MQDRLTATYLETLRSRALHPRGGFAGKAGGGYRPDATAWAVVALRAVGQGANWLRTAQNRLAAQQLADGRVCLSPQHPETFWLTPLAIFAWRQAPDHREALSRASRFLLNSTGHHWQHTPDSPMSHDTALQGWPWIAATHSWAEPTALAVLALRVTGWGEHARVKEAIRMLLDRQLPGGGWNYGNTKVFGQELFPFPESTGLVLNALRGMAPRAQIQKSLDYLKSRLPEVPTPLALAWGLMGLAAWGEEPAGTHDRINECFKRQKRYGPYDSTSLSLLIIASQAHQGLESVFTN